MRLRINFNKDGTKNYYVLESYRDESGKSTSRIIRKLGTHDELLKEHEDPEAWAREIVEQMNREGTSQTVMVPFTLDIPLKKGTRNVYEGGYLFLQKIFYQLHLDYICKRIAERHEFRYDLRQILAHLVYGRILDPASKLSTYEYAKKLLEGPTYEMADMYRALDILCEEKEYIQAQLYKYSKDMGKRNDAVLYYDCTNYYFEIEQESGDRKYGKSKENRPLPIVEMGLFMDGDGIPLAFCLHSGNTNEQTTLQPLEKQIIEDFDHAKFIVCTDAGLSSTANRRFNDRENRAFITTQSIKKMKAFQKEWALSPDGWHLPGRREVFCLDDVLSDETLRKKYYDWVFYKETWYNENDIEQKFIVTFSIKYMVYQRKIRNEQIARAERALASEVKKERTRQSDYKRFITRISVTKEGEVAEKRVYALNEKRIRDEEMYDGFYCIATNLDEPPAEIIRINSGRWEIEECFRIMKHEFKARPVYVQKDNRITAHFLTCFLSLVVFRYLEKKLQHRYTCEEIVTGLREMRFLYKDNYGYIPAYDRTDFTDALHEAYGFRTDLELLPKKQMRSILTSTKSR